MCCNQSLISRIPTSPPPSPSFNIASKTNFKFPSSFTSPKPTGSFKPFTVVSAVKEGGTTAVSEIVKEDVSSFYDLLGISETVSSMEIKQAYKQLARKYHPDVCPPDRVEEYTQRFIRVQEAYETLSDPNRRALYDKDMAMGIHFGFNSRSHLSSDEQMVKSEWRNHWQSQLSELRKRSMYKESGKNASWAARMRKQRSESSS
uniref:chaperone protein dnaJ 20, chloroplastic-like n=1 Tax=Erigeron canadensis TaxID=72917 RepID=UPI001CB94459|nr:chaperone protein dnaJ 20, chloroplastic-like [Erigeron canadensis]